MRDPTRLEEGEATAFERQLLDAAKRQAPGAALKARMREGLGFAGATVPVQAVVAKSFAWGWKANVVVALVGVAASVAVPLMWRNYRGTSSSQRDVISRTPPPGEHAPLSTDDMLRSKNPATGTATAASTLMEEIRLLDRVRDAMSVGAPRRALAEIQGYDQRYPRGALGPEATVLRIEALDQAGDSQSARALGRQFLAQHPKNPLVNRVARIVQR